MFTGIVEDLGTVAAITFDGHSARLEVATALDGIALGDSVSVNGVCLTAATLDPVRGVFGADAMGETIRRTALGRLVAGDRVNLERAMAADGRFGGHVVQGHVDGVGEIATRREDEIAATLAVKAPEAVRRYLVEKGSITVDGVSLTVSALTPTGFELWLIPHTLAHTTLGLAGPGTPVNLEVDVIAKYVERLLAQAPLPRPLAPSLPETP